MKPVASVASDAAEQELAPARAAERPEAKCPWCGQIESTVVWPGAAEAGFSLRRCTNCNLAYTTPQLSASEIKDYYSQKYYGADNLRFNPLLEALVRVFRRRRAARLQQLCRRTSAVSGAVPGTVLDIGCGRGYFLHALREQGWTCTGTELTETAARHAHEALSLDVRIGPFDGADFPDAAFDAVFLWHVLEHMPDIRATLVAARRILQPQGMLVIALPNLESWQARLCGYRWFHLDLPRHYVHCSAGWLTKTLSELGFRIVEVNHFSAEQNVYGWIQSVLNCCGLKANLLYDILKRPHARDINRPWEKYPVQAIISLAAATALLPLATVAMLAEVLFRRGGTVEIYAERSAGHENANTCDPRARTPD